jgi:hypothetical protein
LQASRSGAKLAIEIPTGDKLETFVKKKPKPAKVVAWPNMLKE